MTGKLFIKINSEWKRASKSFIKMSNSWRESNIYVKKDSLWGIIDNEPECVHNWISEEVVNATCESYGYERFVCSICGSTKTEKTANPLGHDYDEGVITTDPTCVEQGVKTYTCKNDSTHFYTELISALGHEMQTKIIQEATCSTAGKQCKACTRCNHTESEEEIPATGIHAMGDWTIRTPATSTSKGEEYRKCQNCDYEETQEIDIISHEHVYGNWEEVIAPGCESVGEERRECTAEDCGYFETREVTALGHDIILHEAQAPTCTTAGWNAYETCSRCNYNTYTEIAEKGHVYGDWVNEVPATCEEEGILGHYYCSECGANFDENKNILESLVIPPTGHDYIEYGAQAPTCTEIGWNAYQVCSKCGDTTYEEISATGHSYGEWTETIQPTCSEKGEKRRYCKNCNNYEVSEISATGHNWEDVELLDDETGEMSQICSNCKEKRTIYIDLVLITFCWESGYGVDYSEEYAIPLGWSLRQACEADLFQGCWKIMEWNNQERLLQKYSEGESSVFFVAYLDNIDLDEKINADTEYEPIFEEIEWEIYDTI